MNKQSESDKIFLVFNTACFGDVLLCNSLCQNIKNIFPESKIVFITDKNFRDVALYQKDVDEVIVFDKKNEHKGIVGIFKFIREFKYKKPYASIITYKNERNYFIAKILGSKRIVMAHKDNLSLSTQEKHNLLLKRLTNNEVKNYPIRFEVPEFALKKSEEMLSKAEKYVVINTISKRAEKDMPSKVCSELIKKISKTDKAVVYVGAGTKAVEYAKQLTADGCKFVDLTNKTSIPELGAVLKNAECLISVDTGTLHLGCAVNVPIISVFYEKNMVNLWAPNPNLYKSVLVDENQTAEHIFEVLTNILGKKEETSIVSG